MRTIVTITAAIGLAACTWVDLTREGAAVSVASSTPTSCRRLGTTTSVTQATIAGIDRDGDKVAGELLTLARNTAAKMGGDTIIAETGISGTGEQTFGVYRCN
jgi:hypothetical protein